MGRALIQENGAHGGFRYIAYIVFGCCPNGVTTLGTGVGDDRGGIVQLPHGLEAFAPAKHLKKELSVDTACMAKYWVTELQGEVVDKCLQFHGGAGLIVRIGKQLGKYS